MPETPFSSLSYSPSRRPPHPLPGMDCKLSARASSRVHHLSPYSVIETYYVRTVLLSRALLKSRSGFKRSDFVLKCIVRRVIQVGLLGTLCALAGLATWFFQRKTTIYEMFDMTVGSIYTHVGFYSSRNLPGIDGSRV